MQCAHVQLRLVERLYGELDEVDRAAIDEHLASCAACRQHAAALQETAGALDRHTVELPEVNVLAVLDEWSRRERRRRIARTGGALLALAASLLVMAALLFDIEIDRHHLSVRWGQAPHPFPTPFSAVSHQLAADSSWALRQRVLRGGLEALGDIPPLDSSSSSNDTLRAGSFYHSSKEP